MPESGLNCAAGSRPDTNPDGKSKCRQARFDGNRPGSIMKKYRVRYETQVFEDREGTEVVSASGKGQAMLAAQQRIHPDVRPDEPYFHFEPLSIRPLAEPGTFEVRYRTKVASDRSGEVEILAASPEDAGKKARFAVHPELIPPRCFRAVTIVEIGQSA